VRIELTRAAGGVSVAVLKTGQTTRPDPLPETIECMEYSGGPGGPEAPYLPGGSGKGFVEHPNFPDQPRSQNMVVEGSPNRRASRPRATLLTLLLAAGCGTTPAPQQTAARLEVRPGRPM
jgi:hypothetical protein